MSKIIKKNSEILSKNSLKVIELKELPETPSRLKLFNRDIKFLKIKDIKRAYSRLIQDYCKGLANDETARTLVYLFSGFLSIIRDIEFEERLKLLEEKVGDEE